MCKCVNLNMLSQCLYKVAVISITIIGCFGLVGNFMKLNLQRTDDQNDRVKPYNPEHHVNLKVLSNESMSPHDLKQIRHICTLCLCHQSMKWMNTIMNYDLKISTKSQD